MTQQFDNFEGLNDALSALLMELTGVGVDTKSPDVCLQMLSLALNNAKAIRHREKEYLKRPEHKLITEIKKILSDYDE